MRNGRGLLGVLLVGFLVLALAACSGSGGSGGEMATVSGRAVDDPVAGADVSVLDISGTVLATGTTDSDGYYAVEVARADIADGFEVLVSGGTVNGEPFAGRLRSFYDSPDAAGGANVTLVTSAAAALGSADPAADPMAGFFEAVALMERIGMVRADEWAETEPGYVDLAALRSRVREMGLDLWLTRLAEDLADEALSPEMMTGFPHAHGGIVSVSMDAEQNRFSALPGDEIEATISMDAGGDGGPFSYEVAGGPDGLEVDADGRVTYALPADETEGRDIPFAIRVVNGETGFGREIAGVISVMAFGEVDNDGDGYTEEQGDCDDGNPAAYPGAAEICDDGVDQDCDGADAVCAELDRDGDGFTGAQGDCDDGNAGAYPGAEEICGDGVDQDCDGADAVCPEDLDVDEDGFSEAEGDCDDEDPARNPGAEDVCGDGVDQDCDGADAVCPTVWYKDADGDGYSDGATQESVNRPEGYAGEDELTATDGDCDDGNERVHPGAAEVCGDGVDQDCSGSDATCYTPPPTPTPPQPSETTWYKDMDGDGYSDGTTQVAVGRPAGYYAASDLLGTSGDCDDEEPTTNAGADEVCADGDDNDCDGEVDEPGCVDKTPPEFAGIATLSVTNNDSVLLRWNPAEDDVTTPEDMLYRVYYDESEGFDPASANLYFEAAGADTVSVEGLATDTSYAFLVMAFDEAGNTDPDKVYQSGKTAPMEITLREDVELVDTVEEALTAPAPGTAEGEYVFPEDPAEPLAVGQYIVGQDSEGNGFLRRVESLRQENGQTVVETSQASMSDVMDPVYVDNMMMLESADDIADVTEVRRQTRSRSGDVETVIHRKKVNSDGSYVVEEFDYAPGGDSDEPGVVIRTGRRARSATARKNVVGLDSTGRLKIVAQNRMVRADNTLAIPVQAYLVDESGQIDTQQELGVNVSFEGMTHESVEDTGSPGNYGAYFDDEKKMFSWAVTEDHVSDKPYKARFKAYTVLTGLEAEIEIEIDVLSKGKKSTTFGTDQRCELNADFYFEPELRTNVDTSWLGNVKEGEIVAAGEFGVNIDALYEFTAQAELERQKPLFLRTWSSVYQAGPVTVVQDITFSLEAQVTASAEAAISAGAFSNLSAYVELGVRYNPETEEWEEIKDSGFNKTLTMNLSVEGKLAAELRLIPRIDVRFYKVATGSLFLEPYLNGSLAAEWVTDADILRQILISQYQMTDMSANLGVDCFFAADLSIWKWNLWKLDKKLLFNFNYPLFSLPELSLAADGDGLVGAPMTLTASVTDGTNNPFNEDAMSWNVYPGTGVITVLDSEPDPADPDATLYHATFVAAEEGEYKIYFSGNSRFGAVTRQYAMTAFMAEEPVLTDGPANLEATVGDGSVTLEWDDLAGATAYTVYGGTAADVTAANATIEAVDVEKPHTVEGLENGTTYYFVVVGSNSKGDSDPSNEVEVTLQGAGAGLVSPVVTGTAGDGIATLTWAVVDNATTYTVYLGSDSAVGPGNYVEMYSNQPSPFELTGLTNGTEYFFVVVAENATESSEPSNVVSLTPSATATVPDPPVISNVSAGNGRVTLTWGAVDGAISYYIVGGASSGGAISITGITTSSYTMEDVENGVTYQLSVVAVNSVGGSAPSDQVSATPTETTVGDTVTDNSGLGMTFVRIPAGTFMMGSPEEEPGRNSNETLHQVTLTQDFYMMTTEVTQDQWEAVMENNPSYFKNCGGDCPVEQVSWNDIQDFITALNARDDRNYRLPTEAEWEYAARAGTTSAFYSGGVVDEYSAIDPNLDAIAWYFGNSDETHPVRRKQPNAWGLYDMSGNVWEWVEDWYGSYPEGPVLDPTGPEAGSGPEGAGRVLRGGSWNNYVKFSRSAYRSWDSPSFPYFSYGFRLALSPGQ